MSKIVRDKWLRVNFYIPNILNKYILTTVVLIVLVYLYHEHLARFVGLIDLKVLLDYLRVLLSWPPIILVLAAVFMNKFSDPIRMFLERAEHVRAGMFEAQASSGSQQQVDDVNAEITDDLQKKGITLSDDQFNALDAEFSRLIEDNSAKASEIKDKDRFIEWLSARAVQFEMKYLDQFLVLRSKIALALTPKSGISMSEFFKRVDTGALERPSEEKDAVLKALQENDLLLVKDGQVAITEKGERLLDYIGMRDINKGIDNDKS